MTKESIPQDLQFAFQEYDLNSLDPDSDAFVIIERVLAYGNKAELRWLFKRYGHRRLVGWLQQGGWRLLSQRRLNLWTTYFNLPPFPERKNVWPY